MINAHIGTIGPLGCYGICPECGGTKLSWESETDVSRCLCGWNNEREAEENRKRMRKNGEAH